MLRNLRRLPDGGIDCELNHPVYGWIPFTARQTDPEAHGRRIYQMAEDELRKKE